MPDRRGFRPSFFEMVAGVWALLKVKGKYDEYQQAAAEDQEGRVALTSAGIPEDTMHGDSHIVLPLDTEIPMSTRRNKSRKACCMCCGYDCTLIWKAIAIVLGLYTLYYGFKAIRWAMTDAPTGLENMPEFSTSLGCLDAPYIYNGSRVTNMIPIREEGQDHAFDIRGHSVGTLTIHDGDLDATEVKYEMTIRTNNEQMLDNIQFTRPDYNEDGTIHRSRFFIDTNVDSDHCMRFDVDIYLPPNLKNVHIMSHADATQVQFAANTRAENMEKLAITLYDNGGISEKNIIRPSANVIAQGQTLEVYNGWIVGEASALNQLEIVTQRGLGVANVKIYTTATSDETNPPNTVIMTTTGGGRSDFEIIRKEFQRKIEATHISAKNADLYLTYRKAAIEGKIKLDTKSYTLTGARKLTELESGGNPGQWTHFVGNPNGGDSISVSSRGWTGLYF